MKLALLRNVAPPQSDNKVANSGPSIFKYIENINPQMNLQSNFLIQQVEYFDFK